MSLLERFKYIFKIAFAGTGVLAVILGLGADYFRVGSGTFGIGQMAIVIAGLSAIAVSFILHSKNLIARYVYSVIIGGTIFILWQFWFYPVGGYDLNPFLQTSFRDRALAISHIFIIFVSGLLFFIAVKSTLGIVKSSILRVKFIGYNIIVVGSIILSGLALEIASSLVVPAWPAREMRPVKMDDVRLNSWNLRDKERTIAKPDGFKRVIFLGDSFLEGGVYDKTLPAYTEDELIRQKHNNIECVNLGVRATGLKHYLYRMREFGLRLSPDAVLLFIYAGNDFLKPNFAYEKEKIRLIDEHPLPSILGTIMPNFTWLLIDKLRLSEYGSNQKFISGEFEYFESIIEMTYEKGIEALAGHMRKYYFSRIPVEHIEEILRRGGPDFWQALDPHKVDREYLHGWRIMYLINQALISDRDKSASGQPMTELYNLTAIATASYVEEIAEDLCKDNISLIVFLIPEGGNVDEEYLDFWRPWYRDSHYRKYRTIRRILFGVLKNRGIETVDLEDVLDGVSGTYRKFDGHWTEKGHRIIAERIGQIIINKYKYALR